MSLIEYTEYLVKNLVTDPDMIKVKDFDTEEGLIIEILVNESDMPSVIGKGGKVANSIKALVQAKAFLSGIKNVKINIDSF